MKFPAWVPKVKQIIRFEIIAVGGHKITECEVLSRTKVIEDGETQYIIFTSIGDILFSDEREWYMVDRSELDTEQDEYHPLSVKRLAIVA